MSQDKTTNPKTIVRIIDLPQEIQEQYQQDREYYLFNTGIGDRLLTKERLTGILRTLRFIGNGGSEARLVARDITPVTKRGNKLYVFADSIRDI